MNLSEQVEKNGERNEEQALAVIPARA